MKSKISKRTYSSRLKALYSSPVALAEAMETTDAAEMPDDLTDWLGRLNLLYGVPYNYLVAEAEMLPEESIRFFNLDSDWVNALIDGASSIGRVPSNDDNAQVVKNEVSFTNSAHKMAFEEDPETDRQTKKWLKNRELNLSDRITKDLFHQKFKKGNKTMNLDRAMLSHAQQQIRKQSEHIRRKNLGYAEAETVPTTHSNAITGFILRSQVVSQYIGLGVNAFELGHTPDDGDNFEAMTILRMERLGDQSDVLLCILSGDVYRVDISEAPEQLHFGLDDETSKSLKTFTKEANNDIDITGTTGRLSIADHLRADAVDGNRVINIANMANSFKTPLNLQKMDSAIFGFEMTEGVGMVTFYNGVAPAKD